MRGLKYVEQFGEFRRVSRIPYGMRGLKYRRVERRRLHGRSHPIRDAWIEIKKNTSQNKGGLVASHTGCVD